MEETTLSRPLLKGRITKKQGKSYQVNKNQVIGLICILLMLNFFYDGIYRIAYFKYWESWITHEPIIKYAGPILKYAIPIIDLGLAFAILRPPYRQYALYLIIISQWLFIFWVMSVYLLTGFLFWPFHAFWSGQPTWMQKMSFSLLLSWLSFITIIIRKNNKTSNK